ncbi:hypothetical protein Bca52824_044145 [Brassica carinata]|uniref:Uncharacterized protein n=1 Tax=Brassica carinata TaxID=52824 RepID=A0A8X7S0V4_BRACI|nr:hypothetical protein Bca52824_044145 [Brassica carinata]
MAQIQPDLVSMEDGCALVVVLWSPSFPPVSACVDDWSRFWVYGELPGGGGDSLLVVSSCVVGLLMRRAELFLSSKPEVAVW